MAQISHSVFSTRTQRRWHYGDSGPKQTALNNHHPPLGPPLGKSRVLERKDTNGIANGAPGLSLKESATPLLTGSKRTLCPPAARHPVSKAGKSHCRVRFSPELQGLEEGPALHLLTGQPPTVSVVSMLVTGSLFSFQGLRCLALKPRGLSPTFLETFRSTYWDRLTLPCSR